MRTLSLDSLLPFFPEKTPRNKQSVVVMIVRETVFPFLLLVSVIDFVGTRPSFRRKSDRRSRTHHHHRPLDAEEELQLQEQKHDNLILMRDIIRELGFTLTFGKQGLNIHIGSENKERSEKSRDMKPADDPKDQPFRNVVNHVEDDVTPRKGTMRESVVVAGRPYILIPLSSKGHEKSTNELDSSKGPTTRPPVTTPGSDFVFPTLLTPSTVTESMRETESVNERRK